MVVRARDLRPAAGVPNLASAPQAPAQHSEQSAQYLPAILYSRPRPSKNSRMVERYFRAETGTVFGTASLGNLEP
jgi:hypothetical protein